MLVLVFCCYLILIDHLKSRSFFNSLCSVAQMSGISHGLLLGFTIQFILDGWDDAHVDCATDTEDVNGYKNGDIAKKKRATVRLFFQCSIVPPRSTTLAHEALICYLILFLVLFKLDESLS